MDDKIKLLKAFSLLRSEFSSVRESVSRLEKVRAIAQDGKPGRDGKDGVSPPLDEIVAAVISQIPEPEKIDADHIIDEVLSKLPTPRDGRDAPVVNVSDVAAVVLANIEKPKDGKNGKNGRDAPDLETIVRRVKSQIKDGERGSKGEKGEKGADGVSVTKVEIKNNELFVWLDGVKRAVGKIKLPAVSAPFNPGGGGARSSTDDYLTSIAQVSVTHPDDPTTAQVAVIGTGDADLQPPTGFVAVESGYEKVLEAGKAFTVLPSGRVQINARGYIEINGYADVRHSANNTTAGVAFSITRDGVTTYSPRAIHTRMPNSGDIGQLSGGGAFLAEPGDVVGVGFASDTTGTLQIRSSSLVFSMKRRA